MKIGTYTGTAAAKNVSIGFIPKVLIGINITDMDSFYFWGKDATDGEACYAGGNKLSAEGVSEFAGNDTAAKGFTLGTNAVVNESGKTFLYIAFSDGESG